MRKLHSKKTNRILVLSIIAILLCSFVMPKTTKAVSTGRGGSLLNPLTELLCFIPDVANNILQHTFVSTKNIEVKDGDDEIEKYSFLYSPGTIFSGQVPAFDINFITPGDDKEEITDEEYDTDTFSTLTVTEGFENFEKAAEDAAQKMFETDCAFLDIFDEDDNIEIFGEVDSFIYDKFNWGSYTFSIENIETKIEASSSHGTIKCYDSTGESIFNYAPEEFTEINGNVLNLATEELREFLYKYYFKAIYNIDYDPSGDYDEGETSNKSYNPKALEDKENVKKLLMNFYNQECSYGSGDIFKSFEFTHECGEGKTIISVKFDEGLQTWTIYKIPEEHSEMAIEKGVVKQYKSSSRILQPIVSSWYKGLRRIALVFLLSVLAYLGIRIVLSSTSAKDKAKYKKMLINWIQAVCLLFMLHYIMSLIIILVTQINSIIGTSTMAPNGEDVLLSKLRNEILNAGEWAEVMAQIVIYIVITIYTVIFTIQYFRRTIYLAFLTMIAPLITLTYPLDKIKDSKAQAFDMWLKDYIFFSLLQVLHLLIYYVFVSQSIDLSEVGTKWSFVYSIVAIGFISHVEKIMKKMFGFQKSKSMGAIAAGATGALVMNLLNKASFAKMGMGSKPSGSSGRESTGKKGVRTTTNLDPLQGLRNTTFGNGASGQQPNPVNQPGGQNGPAGATVQQQNPGNQPGGQNGQSGATAQQQNPGNQSGVQNGPAGATVQQQNPGNQPGGQNGPAGASRQQQNQRNPQSLPANSNQSNKPKLKLGNGLLALGKKYTRPILSKTAGIALGGAGTLIGLSSGVAQGDMGKALGQAVAGGTAGYHGGQKLVNSGLNAVESISHVKDKLHNIGDTFNEGARGKEYVQNAKFDREFYKSEEYKKLMKNYSGTSKATFKEMLDAGITEYKDMNIILKKNRENPTRYTIKTAIGYSTLAKQCPNGVLYKDSKFIKFCHDREIEITPEEAEELRKVLIEFK